MAKKDIIPSGEQNDFIIYHSKDGKVNVALMTRDGRSASGRFACKERMAQPTTNCHLVCYLGAKRRSTYS